MMSPADLQLLTTLHDDHRARLTRSTDRTVTDMRTSRSRRRIWKD